jgi:hypothetical protein
LPIQEAAEPGFTKIVQPGTAISVMLLLDDGQVAFGDRQLRAGQSAPDQRVVRSPPLAHSGTGNRGA